MKLQHHIEYFLFISLGFFIRIIPRNFAYFIVWKVGYLWALISFNRYRIAFQNLTFAFPEYSNSQKRSIAIKSFQHLALSGVDMYRMDLYTKSDCENLIDFNGKENIEKAFCKNKSAIFMTAHLGFWESGNFVLPFLGIKASLIGKKIKNPYIDAFVLRQRSCQGLQSIDKKNGLRKIIKALQEDKSIAILIDQHVQKDEAVFVPFFGRNAYTSPIIVNLAAKKKIPIIPIFCYRQPKNRYQIEIGEPIYFSEDKDKGVTNTTAINLIIEKAIRKSPEQWMWIHRRWRE